MAKKKKKNYGDDKPTPRKMTPEEKQALFRGLGFVASIFGKAMLQASGMEVDFKINGEDISNIEKLHQMDITERIQLAIKEERYEDASNLKKILDGKKSNLLP